MNMLTAFPFLIGFIFFFSGCVSAGRSAPAPVEDHPTYKQKQISKSTKSPSVTAPSSSSVSSITEQINKPGYYTVKQGDTLIRIGLDHGQNWRDLMRWNSIENPNLIEVGQVLRVSPPANSTATEEVIVKPVSPPGNVSSSQVEPKPVQQNQPTPNASSSADVTDDQIAFLWPAQGTVIATFDDAKNKGIDIAGKAGDAVLAAADGKVVYAGSGLRGYGNLVILKHNNTFLTAYAHNQNLAVKEDQVVKRGQKIAEIGNSDSEQVKLHFEIRKLGKPVDPLKLLTPR